jgi:hypothetical protein
MSAAIAAVAAKSGLQKEVLALYRSLLREAIKKDRTSNNTSKVPTLLSSSSQNNDSVTSHVSQEFRKQANSIRRKDFRTIEYKIRYGYKQIKLLQMPGVKTFKSL